MMGWTRVEVARRESLEFLVWLSAGCRPASGSALERIAAGPTLTLRGGTDHNLVHVNISRLIDRERDGAGDRSWRNRDFVHLFKD